MNFFGVGPMEAGVILVIALLVIGPQRFPEIMRQGGRWYRVARAYSNEVMKDVRSAIDEIEQEVKADTDDLRSVRELTDLRADLVEARETVETVGKDTTAAAKTGDEVEGIAGKPGTPSPSIRPSARSSNAGKATPTSTPPPASPPSSPAATPTSPGATSEASGPKPDEPPASFFEGRDPSTYDPFKAKEARDRERAATAREDAENGHSAS